MRHAGSLFFLVLVPLFIVGCAAPGHVTYKTYPASDYNFQNEKYVDAEPSVVWDSLVKEISKSYFMINNIDKESRIINVSFMSDDVSKYVDCGSSKIHVKRSRLNKVGRDYYEFNVCDSNEYISETSHSLTGIQAPVICKTKRRAGMEGRMNIYIAPQEEGTLVTVNCRYITDIKLNNYCEFYAPAGNLIHRESSDDNYQCSLDSKRSSSCEPPNGQKFVCRSKGQLENEILSLVGTSL